jgi:hypothetical protein
VSVLGEFRTGWKDALLVEERLDIGLGHRCTSTTESQRHREGPLSDH